MVRRHPDTDDDDCGDVVSKMTRKTIMTAMTLMITTTLHG